MCIVERNLHVLTCLYPELKLESVPLNSVHSPKITRLLGGGHCLLRINIRQEVRRSAAHSAPSYSGTDPQTHQLHVSLYTATHSLINYWGMTD